MTEVQAAGDAAPEVVGPRITVKPNGPLLVERTRLVVRTPVNTAAGEPVAWVTGEAIETREKYALCRCGQSARKPFCDGTHARVGFDGTETANDDAIAGAWKDFTGPSMVIHDNRTLCTHAGFCGTAAMNVWNGVAKADTTEATLQIIGMIQGCPSGAITYSLPGVEGEIEQDLAPTIAVIPDGPLSVTGRIPVTRSDGVTLTVRARQTLCRCGASSNKPLCDGTHKSVGFTDDDSRTTPAVLRSTRSAQ